MKIVAAFILVSLCLAAHAQQCDGNLGENIFESGDFGSGSTNIPFTDPQIAPGYQYSRIGPPSDGLYVLTNNTGTWPGLYQTWIRIGDNSSDPNGYMMVVNASFEPGNFYQEQVENLCENTLYEFSADVINLIASNVGDHILPSVDFLLNNEVVFSTGDIPQDERWHTYGFTFRTPMSVTEMTLTLRNNAPGGIGNDLALDNISFRACGPNAFVGIDTEETIFLCETKNDPVTVTADLGNSGFQLQWQQSRDQGSTWNDLVGETDLNVIHDNFQPGFYRYRYLSAPNSADLQNFKCRTISDEVEIEVLPTTFDVTDTICEGLSYPLGDMEISTPGVHMATLTSSKNCDSIVTLRLTHQPQPTITFDFAFQNPRCAGDTTGTIELLGATGSKGPYIFRLDNQEVGLGLLPPLTKGTYLLTATDRYSCSGSREILLEDPPEFIIEAGPDTALTLGQTIDRAIDATEFISNITWDPPAYLSCGDCTNPSLVGIENVTYLVSGENERGCHDQDSLTITVDRSLPLYAPNAFTPNGDGVNDIFMLASPGSAVLEISNFQIFNRWGSLVYEATGLAPNAESSGWDGSIGGEQASPDTYLYHVKLRLLDDSVQMKSGTVLLLR